LQKEIVEKINTFNKILVVVSKCFVVLFFALYVAHRKRKELLNELKTKNKEYLEAKRRSENLSKAKSNFFL
jgi:two-component system, sensor histidine kinase